MDFIFLSETILFQGCTPKEIETIIKCLQATRKSYTKGQIIYHPGTIINKLGMVLSGNVTIEHDDVWGNKTIFGNVMPGQVFAETYACLSNEPSLVSVIAASDAEILFLDITHILETCPHSCCHHNKIIHNLLSIMAQKNLDLSHRNFHTAPKSIRGKLLSYLSFQAEQQKSMSFTIPYDRQQLADYLGVDRSALSNELSKMQKEGILSTKKNNFVLTDLYYE